MSREPTVARGRLFASLLAAILALLIDLAHFGKSRLRRQWASAFADIAFVSGREGATFAACSTRTRRW